MSPSANTSGCPGSVRSDSTAIRPARSSSAPVSSPASRPSFDAVTPAAHTTVRVGIRSVLAGAVGDGHRLGVDPDHGRPSIGVTPMRSSDRCALADSDGGKLVSTRSPASIEQDPAAVRGSTASKSPRSVSRASSRDLARHLDPGRPGRRRPRTSARRRVGSGSVSASAASNALRIRPRTASALSSDLTSAANSRHSSWPK